MLLNTLLGIRVKVVFVPLPLRVFLRERKKTKLHHNLLARGNGKGQESDIKHLGREERSFIDNQEMTEGDPGRLRLSQGAFLKALRAKQ